MNLMSRWTWDLIIELDRWEQTHSADEPCFGHVMEAVPAELIRTARAIADYGSEPRRQFPPCEHRPNAAMDYFTPCAGCMHPEPNTP